MTQFHVFPSILILSIHVHLDIPSGVFTASFPTKTLHAFLFSPIRATCPTHSEVEWGYGMGEASARCSLFVCFLWRCGPTRATASSFLRFLDHTQRRITVGRIPLDEWSARRRDLYLTTHNTHNRQTSMPPGGIRTHDLSKRAAADLRLRPRGS